MLGSSVVLAALSAATAARRDCDVDVGQLQTIVAGSLPRRRKGSRAQVADGDVMQIGLAPVWILQHPNNGDARAGCSLAGDRDPGVSYVDLALNDSAHLENYDAGSLGFASRLKAPRTGGIQVRDLDDTASAPANRTRAKSLRAGEGRQRGVLRSEGPNDSQPHDQK